MAVSFPEGKPVPLRWQRDAGSEPLPDRLPPCNPEAEQSLLGAILLDSSMLLEVIELVDVPDFFRADHQVIFQAMKDLYNEGTEIDAVTLADMLQSQGMWVEVGGDETIRELCDAVPHAANAKYYAGIIREKAIARRTLDAAVQILREGYSNQYTAEQLLVRANQHLTGIGIEAEDEETTINPLPEKMDREAFHGVAGEIVDIISPETEACREAILGQFLVAFGSLIGDKPHWTLEATIHRCNLYLCLVGPTGVARKGTSWDVARWILNQCDPEWSNRPILSGLTSGEGLIKHIKEYPGSTLAVEAEFTRLLTNAGREHSNLSHVLRLAWEGPYLWVPSRNDPLYVNDAYFALIGHTTFSDLKEKLKQNDLENGMANRFMWLNVYRDGMLPEGGNFESVKQCLSPLLRRLADAVKFARTDERFHRPFRKSPAALELWEDLYRGPLAASKAGDYAKATVRAAPTVLRLAVIYAVLDHAYVLDVAHIKAAMSFWRYCDATAANIFGDPRTNDRMAKLIAFIETQPQGTTRTDINRRLFHGRASARELDQLLIEAQSSGAISHRSQQRGKRITRVWMHRKYPGP